ncbi:MAG: phage major capsid protein [Gammaproteobacteria bacterium]|nr:phage major capsid protein [Gammaproteobacteria bacterium]
MDIPRLTGSGAFAWLPDDGDVTDQDVSLDSVSMMPKTVAGSVAMSRRLLKQSTPQIDALVAEDLARGAALTIDLAALEGDGTGNSPIGVANTPDVLAQTITDLTAGVPTWEEAVGFVTALDSHDAATGSLAYICTPAVRGGMKTKTKDAGSGQFVIGTDGTVGGEEVLVTSQLSPKRIMYGNWNDLLIGHVGRARYRPGHRL